MKLTYKPTGGIVTVADDADVDHLLRAGFEQVKKPRAKKAPAKAETEEKKPAPRRKTTKKTEE